MSPPPSETSCLNALPFPKMEVEIGSHLNQVRTTRMRDLDERIQEISSELLPSLVVTPDGTVSEADIR